MNPASAVRRTAGSGTVLVLLWLLSLSCPGAVAQPRAETEALLLQTYLDALRSFQADFRQTVFDEQNRPLEQAAGILFMRRPGRFRWDYATPFSQTIVADGTRLWLYDRDLEQVTVTALDDAVGAAPLAVLSGAAPIGRDFATAESFRRDGLHWYRLQPRENGAAQAGQFSELRLAFSTDAPSPRLQRIELLDVFGRRTVLELERVVVNPELDAALFEFEPPPGVDVVEG